ncbi:MAG: acetyltransferase [Epsilonproteobacteria bacterium]|nr:acetyltransferase [Campylobacterota bacterium]
MQENTSKSQVSNFNFTSITEGNIQSLLPLLQSWFTQPHVSKWWPVPKEAESFLDSFITRIRSGTKPYLVVYSNVPIGYIQSYIANTTDSWLPTEYQHSFGIDQFIGEPDYLYKGFGALFIKAFVQKLLTDHTINHVIVDPDASNAPAIKCYTKACFKPVGEFTAPWGQTLLMVLKRADCNL